MPAEWTFLGWPMSVWEVVVVALGVAASTAVAIAAFRASAKATNIAAQNREDALKDARRHERREFYDAAKLWLSSTRVDVLGHHRVEFPHSLKQLADLIDSPSAHEIVWWLERGLQRAVSAGAVGSQEVKNAYETLQLLFGRFGANWVNSGRFEHEPFEPMEP